MARTRWTSCIYCAPVAPCVSSRCASKALLLRYYSCLTVRFAPPREIDRELDIQSELSAFILKRRRLFRVVKDEIGLCLRTGAISETSVNVKNVSDTRDGIIVFTCVNEPGRRMIFLLFWVQTNETIISSCADDSHSCCSRESFCSA